MQDRESSLLAEPALQCVCLHEAESRSFQEVVANPVLRTALRRVHWQRPPEFQLLLHRRRQTLAAIRIGDQNSEQQGAGRLWGAGAYARIGAGLMQLLAASLQ